MADASETTKAPHHDVDGEEDSAQICDQRQNLLSNFRRSLEQATILLEVYSLIRTNKVLFWTQPQSRDWSAQLQE